MILLAVPTFENISPETFRSIYALKGDAVFDYVTGYDCAKARNAIARKALDGGFDYVLMVDSDIVLPVHALEYLMEYPADIVFGIYSRKKKPEETEVFKPGTFDFSDRFTVEELRTAGKARIAVKGAGFGCALVRTQIFNELQYPWFNFLSYQDNTFLSEDLYFCMMAEQNYSMQVDTRVWCGHIARQIIGDSE